MVNYSPACIRLADWAVLTVVNLRQRRSYVSTMECRSAACTMGYIYTFLCACFLYSFMATSGTGSWSAYAAVMEVYSGRDLAIAFTSRVDTAVVLADVWLNETDWHGLLNDGNPILLSKDFTIIGSPSLPHWPLLSMGFVHGKVCPYSAQNLESDACANGSTDFLANALTKSLLQGVPLGITPSPVTADLLSD